MTQQEYRRRTRRSGPSVSVTAKTKDVPVTSYTPLGASQGEVMQLRESMASRAPIEQAKGMIMLFLHCSADDASAVIVGMARQTRTRPTLVAESVLEELASSSATQAAVLGAYRAVSGSELT